MNIQNSILARMVELLRDVQEYNAEKSRSFQSKKRKRRKEKISHIAQRRNIQPSQSTTVILGEGQNQNDEVRMDTDVEIDKSEAVKPLLSVPPILESLTIGINEVTRKLEDQCKACGPIVITPEHLQDSMEMTMEKTENEDGSDQARQSDSTPISSSSNQRRYPLRAILVCKMDVDPPLLIEHLPYLVAACNAQLRGTNEVVKLVTIPKGSENILSTSLGLRRTAVIGLDVSFNCPSFVLFIVLNFFCQGRLSSDQILSTLLGSVPSIAAPWLIGNPTENRKAQTRGKPSGSLDEGMTLMPTHIKQLRTTAPKDIRAAKVIRAKERSEAKERRTKERKDKKTKVRAPKIKIDDILNYF